MRSMRHLSIRKPLLSGVDTKRTQPPPLGGWKYRAKEPMEQEESKNHVRYGQVQNQIIYRNPVKETQSTIVDNSFKSEDFKCLRSHLLNQLIYNHSICLYSSLISYPRMRLQCKRFYVVLYNVNQLSRGRNVTRVFQQMWGILTWVRNT